MTDLHVCIVGAGAVGVSFAAPLFRAGVRVTFVARGETLEHLRSGQAEFVDARSGQTESLRFSADAGPLEQVLAARPDVVLIATKAFSFEGEFDGFGGDIPIVVTHNSVESAIRAAEIVGEQVVIPGVVRGFMHHEGPATARLLPGPWGLNVGSFAPGQPVPEAVGRMIGLLASQGVDAAVLDNIWVDVWEKAMFVATFGALGALADKPLGYALSELRGDLQEMMEETARIGRECGVPLSDDVVVRTMAFADRMDATSTSSMQRDIAAGRRNELDVQLGSIVRMGRDRGVHAPVCGVVYDVLKARSAAM